MLSYQHGYHAGGPADVHKHAALCLLLGHLAKKAAPFCVVDLYAGDGVYDLAATPAQKTKEHIAGIGRVWSQLGTMAELKSYTALLRALNPGTSPSRAPVQYPGSPAIARAALRKDDRLILNELHPAAYRNLRRWAGRDKRLSVHKRDGLEALVGLTPPTIRRGLVLIDPSYEIKSDYAAVPKKISQALRKWPEGIYFIWYPILADGRHRALIDGMLSEVDAEVFACELTLMHAKRGGAKEKEASGLRGTGVIVVNPPWQFDTVMSDVGAWLAKTMTDNGKHTATWLKRSPK